MDLTLVIPAAGRGSRLAKHTPGKPKVLIPIGGKPILQYALDAGLRVPASRIVIIIGRDGSQIQDFFGSSYRGLRIDYAIQPSPLGLAQAVTLAKPYVTDSMLVINGDEIFLDNRHSEMYRFCEQAKADGIVGFLRTSEPERIRIGYGMDVDASGRVVKLIEKPKAPWNDMLGVGTWLVSFDFFASYERTPINETRGERDFVEVIQLMIDEDKAIYGFDLQGEFINLNSPEDLKRAEAALGRRVQAAASF